MAGKPTKKTKTTDGKPPVLPTVVALLLVGLGLLAYNSPLVHRPNAYEPQPIKASVQELKEGNSKEINESDPGANIDITLHLVSGHYTLFDFYSQSCGPCMEMAPRLVEMTKHRPDFAVRSIDVDRSGAQGIDWESPICRQYNIHSLPYFILYGPNGVVIAKGKEASRQVIEIMQKEVYN